MLVVKNMPDNGGDLSRFEPWIGEIPGGGPCNALQYARLENLMDRGASWATVHRVTKSWTQVKPLSTKIELGGISTLQPLYQSLVHRNLESVSLP